MTSKPGPSNMFPLLLAIALASGLSACQPDALGVRALVEEKKALLCGMQRLHAKSDSLWSAMAIYLQQELPADMPPSERTNMIGIKNARLIAAFKAYPRLDEPIRNKVEAAGRMDDQIAGEMKALMARLHDTDARLDSSLLALERQNRTAYKNLKLLLAGLHEQPCDSTQSFPTFNQ